MGRIYKDITWTIGNTPPIRLNRLTKGLDAEVLVKLESFNPMGSVKDRIGLVVIEEAERQSKIKEGTIIVEPTVVTLELHLQPYALPGATNLHW